MLSLWCYCCRKVPFCSYSHVKRCPWINPEHYTTYNHIQCQWCVVGNSSLTLVLFKSLFRLFLAVKFSAWSGCLCRCPVLIKQHYLYRKKSSWWIANFIPKLCIKCQLKRGVWSAALLYVCHEFNLSCFQMILTEWTVCFQYFPLGKNKDVFHSLP